MNESLFNDASPTNLYVVTSPTSTYSCPWIQTSLTCAPAQFVVFHLLHTDRMQLYTVSEKVHPFTFDGKLLWLIAIPLINPMNTVRLSLRSHHLSSALSSLSDSAAKSESWLFLPVNVASTKTPLKYDCSFPLVLSRTRLDFWFLCVAACIVVTNGDRIFDVFKWL